MNIFKEKKVYHVPELCRIELDNEISLALASNPDPMGEPDWGAQNQKSLAPNPFKDQLG